MNKEQIEKMKDMRANGFSYQKIGNYFKISRQRVFQLINNNGGLPENEYTKIKNSVKERDGYKCKLCGNTSISKLVVHHMDSRPKNNNLLNLITICNSCHANIHMSKTKKSDVFKGDKKFLLRMDKNLLKQLKAYSVHKNQTLSLTAEEAIRQFIKEQKSNE